MYSARIYKENIIFTSGCFYNLDTNDVAYFNWNSSGKLIDIEYNNKSDIFAILEKRDNKNAIVFCKITPYYGGVNYLVLVASLRFRSSPSSDGKIIRKLNKGEKLEFLERGTQENINNVPGNWVKVRTEQGEEGWCREEGWCFDAYLEEVKE